VRKLYEFSGMDIKIKVDKGNRGQIKLVVLIGI